MWAWNLRQWRSSESRDPDTDTVLYSHRIPKITAHQAPIVLDRRVSTLSPVSLPKPWAMQRHSQSLWFLQVRVWITEFIMRWEMRMPHGLKWNPSSMSSLQIRIKFSGKCVFILLIKFCSLLSQTMEVEQPWLEQVAKGDADSVGTSFTSYATAVKEISSPGALFIWYCPCWGSLQWFCPCDKSLPWLSGYLQYTSKSRWHPPCLQVSCILEVCRLDIMGMLPKCNA